ncbi:UNVERIFIED_CONTAM: hypothetical protein Slati_3562200 [Sesamum latifolium]|uniref:Uncharacterized protein n=1 Tax=Sesamum latifolium TaxID=2727402 RepID=A0AAW2UL19_9LAMI
MRAEPVWQGFVTQTNELIMLGDGKVINEHGRPRPDDLYMDDEQHGSVRSIGVGINSDAADFGSEVRESLVGGSSEGDIEYFHDHDVSICGSRHSLHDLDKNVGEQSKKDKNRTKRHSSDKSVMSNDKGGYTLAKNQSDGGFSFPPPRDGQLLHTSTGKSLWSNRGDSIVNDDADDCCVANEEMLVPWRRTSKDASSIKSSRMKTTLALWNQQIPVPHLFQIMATLIGICKEKRGCKNNRNKRRGPWGVTGRRGSGCCARASEANKSTRGGI